MRMVTYRLEEFALFDYAGVERHLAKMAAKGWYLDHIEGNFWVYYRKDPANIRYAVTYIPEASQFDPIHTEKSAKLDEYCEETGWTKVTDWLQMQIYCTQDPEAKPLETDETVRFQVIRKAMKKTCLFSNILMFFVFGLQAFTQYRSLTASPVAYLADTANLLLILLIFSGMLFLTFNIGYYFLWSGKSKKLVEAGLGCAPVRFYRIWNRGTLVFVLILLACLAYSMGDYGIVILVGFGGFILNTFLIQRTRIMLRNKGVNRGLNMAVTLGVDLVLVILWIAGIIWGTMRITENADTPVDSYLADGVWWDIYEDELPVRVEDLMDVDYEHYSCEKVENESFLLTYDSYYQSSFSDGENAPSLSYTVTYVKEDFLYDWCVEQYLDEYNRWHKRYLSKDEDEINEGYREVEVYDWHTDDSLASDQKIDRLYQYYKEDEPMYWFIVCKGNLILRIQPDWEMTEDQLKAFVESISMYYSDSSL